MDWSNQDDHYYEYTLDQTIEQQSSSKCWTHDLQKKREKSALKTHRFLIFSAGCGKC